MALFGKKENSGGMINVIRCDEESYLIWKWRPAEAEANSTNRENAIRWGSSLRVKDGEVAVFVYRQKNGQMQDFIEGPHDDTIKTANFPILSSIVGAAFGGGSPFQAEIYFINLAEVIQIKFGVPYFDVFDPRFLDFAVPVAVRGTITFKITDYREFIKLHRLINFDLDDFKKQIQDAVVKYVKGVVTNIPVENGIPVMQIERKILQINEIIENYLKPRLQNDFGVVVKALDIDAVDADKESEGYQSLMSVTMDIAVGTTQAQAEVNIRNMQDMQRINTENMEATLAAQREEAQHAQRMQIDSANFAVHQLNQQTRVGIAGAEALGQMGANGAMNMNSGGGFNPAGMMAGMAMGGAIGQQMTGLMGNMMQGVQQPPGTPGMTPPPPPVVQYNVAVNGQTTGPFTLDQLRQMAVQGQFTPQSQVWKQGMSGWAAAGTVQELAGCFAAAPPPPPPPAG
jgi:membrane protease subunit (stomatin/prohibitin family)